MKFLSGEFRGLTEKECDDNVVSSSCVGNKYVSCLELDINVIYVFLKLWVGTSCYKHYCHHFELGLNYYMASYIIHQLG